MYKINRYKEVSDLNSFCLVDLPLDGLITVLQALNLLIIEERHVGNFYNKGKYHEINPNYIFEDTLVIERLWCDRG